MDVCIILHSERKILRDNKREWDLVHVVAVDWGEPAPQIIAWDRIVDGTMQLEAKALEKVLIRLHVLVRIKSLPTLAPSIL